MSWLMSVGQVMIGIATLRAVPPTGGAALFSLALEEKKGERPLV
jgi:hypothetical protein